MTADECWPLEAKQILVVANSTLPDSVPLASYYMEKRGIPAENLIVLSLTEQEQCSRKEYDQKVLLPLRQYLQKNDPSAVKFQCIVTIHGVPLIVSDPWPDINRLMGIFGLRAKTYLLRLRKRFLKETDDAKRKALTADIDNIERRMVIMEYTDATAALDSEIALARIKEYPLSGWVPNPRYMGTRGEQARAMQGQTFMVSRLDGPSGSMVRRMIDDGLHAEAAGLKGKAYFDARWRNPGRTAVAGYAYYDRSLHRAARHTRRSGKMEVVLDERERLFQPGECPNAALYCGWYSLLSYVDAFRWEKGAIGYHIASLECQTLRKPESRAWCKSMIEKGVAATIGPVGEPFTEAFPPPELFFKLLLSGRSTLVECFARTNPYLSWKMVLIGDPLYRPFKKTKSSDAAP